MVNAITPRPVSETDSRELRLSGWFSGDQFELLVDNRDVLDAIERFESPARAVESLLTIGACATLASSNGFSAQALRKELDGVVERTTGALVELRDQVAVTISDEGPLAQTIAQVSGTLVASLREMVANQADPDAPGTLVSKIQASIKTLDDVLASTRRSIATDFKETADRQSDSIGKALREMRDLDPSSALGRALAGIEKTVAELSRSVAASNAKAGERQRGTAKGADYEEFVATEVAAVAAVHGDVAERTGNQPGQLILNKKPSLRGDITVCAEHSHGIVVEAMDRNSDVLTSKLVNEELSEAMGNRAAQAAIAVISGPDNRVMCGQHLQLLGDDRWAVVLQKDEPNVLALQVAYRLARAKVLAPPSRARQVDVDHVTKAVEDINRRLSGLAEVKAQLSNISRCGEKAQSAVSNVEREVREAVLEVVNSLTNKSDEQEDAA